MEGDSQGHGVNSVNQLDNTIRAVHQKRPVPEIDFTLHTMEDGAQVSTQERVCKGRQQKCVLATDRMVNEVIS